jgi:cellulose synthase/poly-beta-1,6-N-acetylglucosamine synthase-like glycosyltransferase
MTRFALSAAAATFRDPEPARRPAPHHRALGQILLDMGAITPAQLLQALALQTRHAARLGDILVSHGMTDDATIQRALALQFGVEIIDPEMLPHDPALIDRLGPARCLELGLMPWRRMGAITLVASARPDSFLRHQRELEDLFGPVAMGVAPLTVLHDAILTSRQPALRLLAETCVRSNESCRDWSSKPLRIGLALGILVLLALALVFPAPVFLFMLAIVVVLLGANTALKIAATLTALRAPAGADHPAPETRLSETRLPVISVLVPLFRETDIAPRLVARLGALSYPRELLDVLLVVEETDTDTRRALHRSGLPHWMRVIAVPDSTLRTKPRALNYALHFTRGTLIGIYDAEDAPEPDQLHRVARRFAEGPGNLGCVQGALDFYNAHTNWLARCFTIEYAAWFRLILPGMARMGLTVPLGGTTLFLRREALRELGGWDAHNVTEDADLGVRLARYGWRTELLDTTTFEEANCRLLPWVRQRSRWLKGYAMTYAVHMRDPVLLWRQLGPWRFMGVQVLFLSTLVQFLLAPLLWSFWLVLAGLDHHSLDAIPAAGLWALAGLFLLSEVTTLSVNLIALTLTRHRRLALWVPTLHLYFPLATLAAYKALWEMILSPFYWDKTQHGLHDHTRQPALWTSATAS